MESFRSSLTFYVYTNCFKIIIHTQNVQLHGINAFVANQKKTTKKKQLVTLTLSNSATFCFVC